MLLHITLAIRDQIVNEILSLFLANHQETGASPVSQTQHPWHMVPLLSDGDCADVIERIDGLRTLWTQRDPLRPFFTLGTASYLDAVTDQKGYYQKLAFSNAVLRQHFSDLLDNVSKTISEVVDTPCQLSQNQALPGFHIFGSHPDYLKPVASIHTDLQHEALAWDFSDPETKASAFDQVLTFTLPLVLPSIGAGLHVWDKFPQSIRTNMLWLNNDEFLQNFPPRLEEYRRGQLIIHDGKMLHQIAPLQNDNPDNRRITLQGHGILIEGVYNLYW